MPELVAFAALDWEARAMCDALGGLEPGSAARSWRGHLGDGTTCLVLQIGIGPARAAAAAAAAPVARALLSVGCAGALVAPLTAGDLIAAGEVLAIDGGAVAERLPAHSAAVVAWGATRGLGLTAVPIASGPAVVDGAVAKARLAETGAVAVEMESAPIAAEARRRGVPFVGLRVVLDGPEDGVPLLGGAVDEATGAVRPLRAAVALASRPSTWPAVLRIARQQRIAERRLRALCAVLAGGGLDAFVRAEPTSAAPGPGAARLG